MQIRTSTNLIVVHCSDSDKPEHDNVETIRTWHRVRGFETIGYQYVITQDGKIHPGRPLMSVGAHTLGYNLSSIGICLTGRNHFSEEQFHSLRELNKALHIVFPTINRTLPHNHFDKNKTCPNFNLEEVLNAN